MSNTELDVEPVDSSKGAFPIEGKSKPIIKKELKYKEGFENQTAEFETFKGLPINAGFSWGSESGTMSFKWKDQAEADQVIRERVSGFLRSINIEYPHVIHMLGVFEGPQDQIQAVDRSDLVESEDETVTKANFAYTLDPDVAVVIRPGDCPISVLYGKTKDGRNIAGFVHSSGVSVNAGIPRLAIEYWLSQEEVDPTSIRIGITPGISRVNYSITEENTIRKITYPIIERNWKENIDPKMTDSELERRHVDITGATIMQYIEAGINPEQIEVYAADTYEAHKHGIGYSHRLYEESQASGNQVIPGRFMVAFKLRE